MTNQHPITPPPELLNEWYDQAPYDSPLGYVGTRAAQWGADQELEACCEWLENQPQWMEDLHAARRPKPPSLSRVALLQLDVIRNDLLDVNGEPVDLSQIRRALERLQQLENNQ